MEDKSKRTARRFLCDRLLTRLTLRASRFFCAAFFCAALGSLSAQDDFAVFRAEKTTVFLTERIAYTLAIYGAEAGDVTFDTPGIKGLVLLFMQKSSAVVDGKPAVVIKLLFRAEKTGTIMPPPFVVTVNGRHIEAFFEAVTIKENPAAVRPSMRWNIENADSRIYAGAKVFFTVSVYNAASVESLVWTLNADSMLREIPQSAGAPGGVFTARFEWVPLAAGMIELPRFSASVTTFAGVKETVVLEGVTVRIERAENPGADSSRALRANEQAFLNNAFGD